MNVTRALVLVLAFAESGCAVSSAGISPSEVAFNQCTTDQDCGSSGSCNFNVCQGQSGELTSLLIAVTPPSTLVGVNSFTYFIDRTSGNALGSGGSGLDLKITPALTVSGVVTIDPACDPGQSNGDYSIPATVTFTPSQGAFGVPVDSFSAKSALGTNPAPKSYEYQQTMPAGEYDVYVKPASDTTMGCPTPPRLFLNEIVTSTFNFTLTAPSTLNVNVTWPLAKAYVAGAEMTDKALEDPLLGWTLDLIDQSTGRVLSTAQLLSDPTSGFTTLTPPTPGDTSVTYTSIPLVYAHASAPVKGVLTPVAPGTELLRLTPPVNDPRFSTSNVPYTAPIILAQLDGALVNSDGKPANAQIVQTTSLATPVTVQFQTALSDGTPMPAGVLVTAESIDGITGLSTAFSRSIQVGADGTGSVDLLPGRYRVLASPAGGGCTAGSCLALVETEWLVGATPPSQAGKVIEFSQATPYSGSAVVNATGRAAAGATVHATSSVLTADSNVLNAGDAATAVSPRATSGLVEGDGSFGFEADTGVFDVRVEPDPNTGYGWAVMPGVSLPSQQDALNSLGLDWPVIYRGKASLDSGGDSTTPIPKALIRAYAFLNTKDGTLATEPGDGTVAIEVAETYSDDASGEVGSYRLLVPKSLTKP
jgi:hypothetical protein